MRSERERPAESTMWLCRKSGARLLRVAGFGDGDEVSLRRMNLICFIGDMNFWSQGVAE